MPNPAQDPPEHPHTPLPPHPLNGAVGFLETIGLTPAMVALDTMTKTAAVRVVEVELNDLCGVCLKLTGPIEDVQTALAAGRQAAERMNGRPITTVLTQTTTAALAAIRSRPEFNPLIQQTTVFVSHDEPAHGSTIAQESQLAPAPMDLKSAQPAALGFIETQGFTAVFEAIDTACKAANVEVVGKEKLGGGYVTIVIQGQLSAVTAAIDAGKTRVGDLGKLIAAHVIARPSPAVLSLLPKI